MPEVKRILYPVELTAISEVVAPWAAEMAARFEADLHVLHVVPSLEFWGVAYASAGFLKADEAGMESEARQRTAEFCLRHFYPAFDPTITIRTGKPAEQIIAYVEENGIDMVIMGTHGQMGLDRALFGSVADRVLRQCPVPVTCVNPLKLPEAAD